MTTRPEHALRTPAAPDGIPVLSDGDIGPALVAVELALTSDGPWDVAEKAINELTRDADASPAAGLFRGAPAAAFVMDAADVDGYFDLGDPQLVLEERLRQAEKLIRLRETQLDLDVDLRHIVTQRLAAAKARRAAHYPPTSAEFGLVDGMLGLGVIVLRRAPGTALMLAVIDYVVELTRPVLVHGVRMPGWFVADDPAPEIPTPGGHVSMTVTDGAAGLLAFLATCVRAGYTPGSLQQPIETLVDWLIDWAQPPSATWPDSVWWPRWVTPAEVQAGNLSDPERWAQEALPSWSRMAGIARALQMGAIVLGSVSQAYAEKASHARGVAERAMLACLTDRQLRRLTEPGLRDGLAGLYQTGHRAAADASGPTEIGLRHRMSAVGDAMRHQVRAQARDASVGLWTGSSGVGLAAQTFRRGIAPTSRWDACLLITGPEASDARDVP
jgi:hypothetical protein